MSLDVFLQAFRDGDAVTVDAALVLETLALFSTAPITADSEHIETTDGEAQIFGLDDPADGLMINHASGRVIWDAVVHLADITAMTIIPVGCPTCVTRPELLEHLPDELKVDTRIVLTGEQLLSAFS